MDANLMNRLSGTALDFLVVCAMSTINLRAVANDIWPFLILMVWGLVWQVGCVLVLSRYLNPTHWFENAICVFGQSTGVIAAGLVLLRSCDPKSPS